MSIVLIDGDPLLYTAMYGRNLEDAKENLDEQVQAIIEGTFADEYRIAVKGKNNFRLAICPDYKAQRKEKTPEEKAMLSALHSHLKDAHGAVQCDGMEADDQVAIWATELGDEAIIASIDKDLKTVPGTHYNPRTGEIAHVTPQDAIYFEWQQILQGDSADNIRGIPGVGPAKARRTLDEGLETGLKNAVIDAYKEAFGDTWEEELTKTGKLIHMKRSLDDEWNL